jgi:sugar lactone lactonase YvrE
MKRMTPCLILATPLRGTDVALTLSARWSLNATTMAGCHGPGSNLNQLQWPCGLYVHDDLTVYVADSSNHRIVAWSPGATEGEVVAGGNGEGDGLHQLSCPTDVTVDRKNDELLICDGENRRVVRWPRHGGTQGEILLSNISCEGLAMDDRGFVYVSDYEKQEVRRWLVDDKSKGELVAGGNGTGDRINQLSFPTFLFVDRDHSLYVTDKSNNRVMKWVEGAKVGRIVAGGNGFGSDLKQLNLPNGVLVDGMGTVYVADECNNRVMVWPREATEGSAIVGGNGKGSKQNQLFHPRGLSFDRHGHLYVADWGNSRVQKYELLS